MRSTYLPALFAYVLPVFCQVVVQNWTSSPFYPQSLPLAARSPYMNFWFPQGSKKSAALETNSEHWYGVGDTTPGFYVNVVVDKKEYRLFGQYWIGEGNATQTAVEFTATRTTFVMDAGGVRFNMSFLNPIEAKNLTLFSLPFVYLSMTAESTDGQRHRVRMYSDVEGGTVAGKRSEIIQWKAEDAADSSEYIVLSMRLQNQAQFTEELFVSKALTVYYAFKKITGTTASWSIANIDRTRGRYVGDPSNGQLDNAVDPDFRAENSGSNTAALGIAVDWGNITSTPEPAVWCAGVVGDPSIQYRSPDNLVRARRPYFMADFRDATDATKFFLDDFQRAQSAAQSLDAQIAKEGELISEEYSALLASNARQVMGSMDVTLPEPDDGEWDRSNIRIFMKNMGSFGSDAYQFGDIMTVNNVGTLYAAFPALLYFNPEVLGYLLAPLLEFQNSSLYSLPYAVADLGSTYPKAIADTASNQHNFGIDTTASMIIMSLAYSLSTGNGTLLREHYSLLSRWADYLVNNSVSPTNQWSSDFSMNSDFTRDNQANLALKGIIAISAMAQIAEAIGNMTDQTRFNDTANSAIATWQAAALSDSYINFILNDSTTSGIAYNLYADKLLRLDLIPQEVYELSTEYIQKTIGNNFFGVPLTSTPGQNTTSSGMMFAAASVTDPDTQKRLVSQLHAYISNNLNSQPLSPYYDPSSGAAPGKREGSIVELGRNSPAQGSIFSILSLSTTSHTIRTADEENPPPHGNRKLAPGAIAGIVIGSLFGISGLFLIAFLMRRHHLHRNYSQTGQDSLVDPFTPPDMGEHRRFSTHPNEAGDNEGSISNEGPDYIIRQQYVFDVDERRGIKTRELLAGAHGVQSNSSSDPSQPYPSTDTYFDQDWVPREEFISLRREVEQLRRERRASLGNSEAPPSYSDMNY